MPPPPPIWDERDHLDVLFFYPSASPCAMQQEPTWQSQPPLINDSVLVIPKRLEKSFQNLREKQKQKKREIWKRNKKTGQENQTTKSF